MSVYVFHNRYGKGVLTGIDAGRASVEFEDSAVGVKKFPYPDAFESFLCYEDAQKQGEVMKEIEAKQLAEATVRAEHLAAERERVKALVDERAEAMRAKRTRSSPTTQKAISKKVK